MPWLISVGLGAHPCAAPVDDKNIQHLCSCFDENAEHVCTSTEQGEPHEQTLYAIAF